MQPFTIRAVLVEKVQPFIIRVVLVEKVQPFLFFSLVNVSFFFWELIEYGKVRLTGITGMKWEEVDNHDAPNSTMTTFLDAVLCFACKDVDI